MRIADEYAGRKSRCPKCRQIVTIPAMLAAEPVGPDTAAPASEAGPRSPLAGVSLLDVPQDKRPSAQQVASSTAESGQTLEEEPAEDRGESPPKRSLPFVLDIFLYPVSKAGLITLAVILLTPLLLGLARELFSLFPLFFIFYRATGFLMLIADIVIVAYFLWYLAECVRDSALGGIRAPETLGQTPGLGEMFSRLWWVLCSVVVFAGPFCIYYWRTGRTDAIFWTLLGCGIVLFPIGLLSVVMFASLRALNPILLIGSILSTFLPYLAFVVVLGVAVLAVRAIVLFLPKSPATYFVLYFTLPYLLFVAAHILGCFYKRYEKELNWDV